MKILVTGAAGDIGSHLVQALLRQGYAVRALVRNAYEAGIVRKFDVEIFTADIANPKTLDGAAIGIDTTYHLAAVLFVVNPEEELHDINYEGTINLADECADKGAKRFIFPSVPLILGPHETPTPPISPEEARGQTNSLHALYKKLSEQHLIIMNGRGKLDTTILRLGTVYGPDIRLIRTLKSFMRRGIYRIPGDGNNIASFAHIEDVVQAMLLALTHKNAIGQIYNVADDMPVRFKNFVFELADLMNVPRPGTAPLWAFRVAASLSTAWARLTGSPPLINDDILTFSTSSFAADTTRTKNELGFRPIYPTIYEGLPTCVGVAPEERRPKAA